MKSNNKLLVKPCLYNYGIFNFQIIFFVELIYYNISQLCSLCTTIRKLKKKQMHVMLYYHLITHQKRYSNFHSPPLIVCKYYKLLKFNFYQDISQWEDQKDQLINQNTTNTINKNNETGGKSTMGQEKNQKQILPNSFKKQTKRPIKNLQLNGELTDPFINFPTETAINYKVDNSPPNLFRFNQFLQTHYTMRQKYMKINKEKYLQYELQNQTPQKQNSISLYGESYKNFTSDHKNKYHERGASLDIVNSSIYKQTTEERIASMKKTQERKCTSQQNRKYEDSYFSDFLHIQGIQNSKVSSPKGSNLRSFQYPTTAFLIFPREEDLRSAHTKLVLIDHDEDELIPFNFKINDIKLNDEQIPQAQILSSYQEKLRKSILRQLAFKQNIAQSVRAHSAYSCNRKKNSILFNQFQSISPNKTKNSFYNQSYNPNRKLKTVIPKKRKSDFNTIYGVRVELQQRQTS